MTGARFWGFFVPVLVLVAEILIEKQHSSAALEKLLSENGPVELFQWAVIFLAFCAAALTLVQLRPKRDGWLFGWVLLALLGCLYVAGEEVSWGQHFLNWDTPAYWQALNDQQETNLHNTSSWLDQKPRLILLIGIVTGGIIFPLLQKYKPGTLPEKLAIVYPPAFLMPTALLVLGPYLVEKILTAFDRGFFERVSEVQEVYMFYFVLLYMVVLRRRIVNRGAVDRA